MGFFSDLVKGFEADVRKVLPTDGPHDTRELADLAKSAEGVADTLDPELEPLFATVGAAGDAVDAALHDLADAVGNLHTHVAKRLASVPVTPAPAVAVEPEPTEADAGPTSTGESAPAETEAPTPIPGAFTEPIPSAEGTEPAAS